MNTINKDASPLGEKQQQRGRLLHQERVLDGQGSRRNTRGNLADVRDNHHLARKINALFTSRKKHVTKQQRLLAPVLSSCDEAVNNSWKLWIIELTHCCSLVSGWKQSCVQSEKTLLLTLDSQVDVLQDEGWKLSRNNYYQEGWLATANMRGVVGVTYTTSFCAGSGQVSSDALSILFLIWLSLKRKEFLRRVLSQRVMWIMWIMWISIFSVSGEWHSSENQLQSARSPIRGGWYYQRRSSLYWLD